MNAAALKQLMGVREHRVEMARAALEAKRRLAEAREADAARLQKSLEETLLKRMARQRTFDAEMAEARLSLLDAQCTDQFLGRLTDEATRIGEDIVAARKSLAKAMEAVAVAQRTLRHAMAKRDALSNLADKVARERARVRIRLEEEESEEIASRRESLA